MAFAGFLLRNGNRLNGGHRTPHRACWQPEKRRLRDEDSRQARLARMLIYFLIVLAASCPSAEGSFGFTTIAEATVYPPEIVFLILLAMYFWKMISRPGGSNYVTPLHRPMVCLLVLCAVATVYGASLNGVRLALYDVRPIFYYLLYFVIVDVVRTRQQLNSVLSATMLGTLLYGLVLFSMYAWANNPLRSFVDDPNGRLAFKNAALVIVAFPSLLAFALRKYAWHRSTLVNVTLGVIYLFIAVSTQSRALWVVLSSCVVLQAVLVTRSRYYVVTPRTWLALDIACIMMVIAACISLSLWSHDIADSPLVERAHSLLSVADIPEISEVDSRIVGYGSAYESMRQSPIVGRGFGSVFYITGDNQGTYFDSSFATLYLKTGIVGFACLLWIIVVVARDIAWGAIHSRNVGEVFLYGSFAVMFSGLLVLALQDILLFKGRQIFVIAAMLGLLEASNRIMKTRLLGQGSL